MKRLGFAMSMVFVVGAIFSSMAVAQTGNGAPSGAHYTLNIIGVPQDKSADIDSGHRIFVDLFGRTVINLVESDGDFAVLDGNGTDGVAAFTLPHPDPDGDGVTAYSVYARALGTPGGSSVTTTCAFDDGVEVCSTESLLLLREKGKSSFGNVSRELLFIYADLDRDGSTERYPLFDDALEGYFWQYDNSGLRIAQLRFYEVPTDVN